MNPRQFHRVSFSLARESVFVDPTRVTGFELSSDRHPPDTR